MRTNRKKKRGSIFKKASQREQLIKRIARNRKRLKDIKFQEAVKSILAQFSSRGGNLTDRQWGYLKLIDKSPLYRKPRHVPPDLKKIDPSVYVMATSRYIKIGKSASIQQRLSAIQSGNPETVRILCKESCASHQAALDREQALHRHFASKRVRGEWFDISIKDELLMMMK